MGQLYTPLHIFSSRFDFDATVHNLGLCSLKVVDCRMCGDPNSVLRFAFIEFTDEGNISISNHTSVCFLCVMNLLFIG
jgi:hypothetical protein